MATELQQIADLLTQIKRTIDDMPASMKIAAKQVFTNSLSDINSNAGLLTKGEFRVGNGKEPGQGFTGVRRAYPPMTYNGQLWHDVAVANDALQDGLNATDGKRYMAGGKLVVSQDGVTMNTLGYPYIFDITDENGNQRIAKIGMKAQDNSTIPVFEISYANPTFGSECVTNGGFETGEYVTDWTASDPSYPPSIVTEPRSGTYALKIDWVGSLTAQSVFQGVLVNENTPYEFFLSAKSVMDAGDLIAEIEWYDAGTNSLRVDELFRSSGGVLTGSYQDFSITRISPNNSTSAIIYIYYTGSESTNNYVLIDDISLKSLSSVTYLTFDPVPTAADGAGNSLPLPLPVITMYTTTPQEQGSGDSSSITYDTIMKDGTGTITAPEYEFDIPVDGIYLISGYFSWESNANGYRLMFINAGSTEIYHMNVPQADLGIYNNVYPFSIVVPLTTSDSVYTGVEHNAGTALDITSSLSIVYLGNYNA